MPRQLLAILLLFSLSAQVLNRPIFVLGYYFDPAPYAKACENKALPQLHCNGKCQLMKKLKEQEWKGPEQTGASQASLTTGGSPSQ